MFLNLKLKVRFHSVIAFIPSIATTPQLLGVFSLPPVPELAEPDEGLGVVHLLLDELGHHVPGVDVDGADGHDLLPVAGGQVAQEVGDQGVQLGHLGDSTTS